MDLEDAFDFSDRFPNWLQPAYFGATFLIFLVLARMGGLLGAVILSIAATREWGLKGLLAVPGLLLLVVPGGALAGLMFSFLGFLRGIGFLGMWLRCTAAVGAYSSVTFALVHQFSTDAMPTPGSSLWWTTIGVVSVLFGTLMAFMWRDLPDDWSTFQEAPAERQVSEAEAADLRDIREWAETKVRWRKHLAAIEAREPSPEYVQHWQRIVRRLTPWGGPARQQRLAWKQARRRLEQERRRVSKLSSPRAA